MKKTNPQYLGSMAALAALLLTPAVVQAVPSFARQTGMSCESCHTAFPELTAMGRSFKASGYSFGVKKVKAKASDDTKDDLGAPALPPISAMLQASYTVLKSQPDPAFTDAGAGADRRGTAVFPQQASLFLAGEVAPDLGTFIQMTYDSSFHFDNSDIRYAHDLDLLGKNVTLGLDMNNNPTVQDLWNSTPAWGQPYAVPGTSAFGPASPQIASLGAKVMGVGGYAFYNNMVYAEVAGYRSSTSGAPEGGASPAIIGLAPYWRVALVNESDETSCMLGAYGLGLDQMGNSAMPLEPSNHFDDVAIDTQFQYVGERHIGTVMGSYTHERSYMATFPTAVQASLDVMKVSGSYLYDRKVGGTLGLQNTRVDDGVAGLLDSRSVLYQVDYLFALNTKFSLQYVQYLSADGFDQGNNYTLDANAVSGRNPEDNNTLMAQAWLVF